MHGIPYMAHKIVVKQMPLHPDIFIIVSIFTIDNFAPRGFDILLGVRPKIAIIIDSTLHLLLPGTMGLTLVLHFPCLREHPLMMTSIWSTVAKDSVFTPHLTYRNRLYCGS